MFQECRESNHHNGGSSSIASSISLGPAAVTLNPTPIACLNCSKAKTGCDKRVPCSRCLGKKLECAPRYARRQSRAAIRARENSIELQKRVAAHRPPGHAVVQHQQQQQTDHGAPSNNLFMGFQQNDPMSLGLDMSGGLPIAIYSERDGTHRHLDYEDSSHLHASSLNLLYPSVSDQEHGFSQFWANGGSLYEQLPIPIPTDLDQELADDSRTILGSPSCAGGSIGCDESPFGSSTFSSTSEASVSSALVDSQMADDVSSSGKTAVPPLRSPQRPPPPPRSLMDVSQMSISSSIAEQIQPSANRHDWLLARCNESSSDTRDDVYSLSFNDVPDPVADLDDIGAETLECAGYEESPAFLEAPKVAAVTPAYRDSLLAALSACKLERPVYCQTEDLSCPMLHGKGTSILHCLKWPPVQILTHFLKNFTKTFSSFYSLHPRGCLNPNELAVQCCRLSALLNFSMIARGASVDQHADAQSLAEVLAEACRTMYPEIIGRLSELAREADKLHCALIVAQHGAWSGDDELMGDAILCRSSCIQSIRVNILRQSRPHILKQYHHTTGIEHEWETWTRSELSNRLVYNWALLDLEISLFYDLPPQFSSDELQCPLPSTESLWKYQSATDWAASSSLIAPSKEEECHSAVPSLQRLLSAFTRDEPFPQPVEPRSQVFKLLLYAIQEQIYHVRQLQAAALGADAAPETNPLMQNAQALLEKWQRLATHQAAKHEVAWSACWVLYHVVYLNTLVDFSRVESLARSATPPVDKAQCTQDHQAAEIHCSQALALLRDLVSSPSARYLPAWWPVAVYRLTLVSWANSISQWPPTPQFLQCRRSLANRRQAPWLADVGDNDDDDDDDDVLEPSAFLYGTGLDIMDGVVHNDTPWAPYFADASCPQESEGRGAESSASESSDAGEVLLAGLSLLKRGPGSRFQEGIIRRLETLRERCKTVPGCEDTEQVNGNRNRNE